MKSNPRLTQSPSLHVVLILLVLLAATIHFRPVHAISSTIVISEFRTRGPNGGNDEFIELFNLSASPLNLSGWILKGSNRTGTISNRVTINPGTIIGPNCRLLFTNSSSSGGPYSGSVPGDQTYSVGISDDGGVAITMPDGSIVDQVGMASETPFKEGTPLAPLSSNTNSSYERRSGAGGPHQDSDNNVSDFSLISQSGPQNSSAACSNPAPLISIRDIQGQSHTSPMVGSNVSNISG